MILRRLVEALGALPERRHAEEVKAFLASHPIDGAKQAIAQTLERMQMDTDLRDRLLGPVGDWLKAHAPEPRNPQSGRNAESGIGRTGGMLVAALVAAAVFGIGVEILPHSSARRPAPAPAPAPAAAAHPETAPPARPDAAPARDAVADAIDASNRDAAPVAEAAAPETEHADAAAEPPAPSPRAEPGSANAAVDKSDSSERPTDKDIAHEAWRNNKPDVRVDGDRASVIIPLKGSATGATYHVTQKPHAVIMRLPKAAALITMHLYKIQHYGFRQVWVYQNETNAKAEDGTVLKVIVSDQGPPEVEVHDDFVRVTIHRPEK
jgi:hypothetical protein